MIRDKGDRGNKGAFSQRVHQIVSMIPEEKVATTYGQIALLIGVLRADQADQKIRASRQSHLPNLGEPGIESSKTVKILPAWENSTPPQKL